MSNVPLDKARRMVQQASKLTVLTGAGISAESGVPTFRGSAGLWKQFRPEDLATPEAFARNPDLVWEWYDWRRGLIAKVQPNAGHCALAEIEQRIPQFTLVTQNVDGLHQQAESKSVLEIHGSIWKLRCTACSRAWLDRSIPLKLPPRCECGSLARPGVVWFGENLPVAVWAAAERATAECDALIVVGTSAVVYPAAGLIGLAKSMGAKVIEVNLEVTPVSGLVDYTVTGPAGQSEPLTLTNRAPAVPPGIDVLAFSIADACGDASRFAVSRC
ncbi:MAG: SIR2 family NAD-dependent protein deacylase, partial [Bryobacteraceae bacterium]